MKRSLFPDEFEISPLNFNDEFSLRYHVRDKAFPNSIDSSVLITSLEGFEGVVSTIADEAKLKVSLKIRATKEGSFELICQLVGVVGGSLSILQWFGIDCKAVKGPVGKAFLKIQEVMIKALKSSVANIDEFTKKVRDDPDLSINAKEFLIRLRNNAYFCEGMDDFTKPLDDPSIEKIEIVEDGKEVVEIDEKERKSFTISTLETTKITNEDKKAEIVYLSPTKTEWEFVSGAKKFWAEIQDKEFLATNKIFDLESARGKQYSISVTTVSTLKKNARRATKKRYITKMTETPAQGNLFNE